MTSVSTLQSASLTLFIQYVCCLCDFAFLFINKKIGWKEMKVNFETLRNLRFKDHHHCRDTCPQCRSTKVWTSCWAQTLHLFKSRYGCCLFLPASKSRRQSSSAERQEDRGSETSAVSPSLSPPLGPVWQHLLPPLHFPIMQWACPLCSPPCFIVLANHCPHQAVPTMHQWWPEGAGEAGVSEGMTPSTQCLQPPGRGDNKQNTNKNNALTPIQEDGRNGLHCVPNCQQLTKGERFEDASFQIWTEQRGRIERNREIRKKRRKTKWKREMELWEKIRAQSLGTCDRWSSWISCPSLCDLGCCGHFVCSNSTMEEGWERNVCFPTRFSPKNR